MNRKKFLSSLIPAAGIPILNPILVFRTCPSQINPPYLKEGDIIGITCPAGYLTALQSESAIKRIESWGFKAKIGDTVGKKDFTYGGTDKERTIDFQGMLDDPDVKAILCARGGYGCIRIIDELYWDKFIAKPKWIIGFSDITVIHCHLARNFGISSIHSKMCNSFPDDWNKADPDQIASIISINKALRGDKMNYSSKPHDKNVLGSGHGELIGGNLRTIETLSGTASEIETNGKILFVEDTGEYKYSLDRMFWHLKRAGKLTLLKGLIVGSFNIKQDDPGEEFGAGLEDIVLEKVRDFGFPVCFNFPVGHQKENYALKCGIKHKLEVTRDRVTLVEI